VPPVPVLLGALGPQMVRVAGKYADGVLLNWANEERVTQARETIASAARSISRDPGEVIVGGYIRISVDEDEERARRAIAEQTIKFWRMGHYRVQWEKLGFEGASETVQRHLGAGDAKAAAESLPDEFLESVAAWGPPAKAARRFAELAAGLDFAIARVIPARPGIDGVMAVLDAVAPARRPISGSAPPSADGPTGSLVGERELR
jgi:alkanesulfonate monooxygenase SsuD/methylene tetrahydromethanopterin reductase-like flavin-dependent oxidoreductase (luciferase family)